MLFSKQRKCERVGVRVHRGRRFNCLLSLLHWGSGDDEFLYPSLVVSILSCISDGIMHPEYTEVLCLLFLPLLTIFSLSMCVWQLLKTSFFRVGLSGSGGLRIWKKLYCMWSLLLRGSSEKHEWAFSCAIILLPLPFFKHLLSFKNSHKILLNLLYLWKGTARSSQTSSWKGSPGISEPHFPPIFSSQGRTELHEYALQAPESP